MVEDVAGPHLPGDRFLLVMAWPEEWSSFLNLNVEAKRHAVGSQASVARTTAAAADFAASSASPGLSLGWNTSPAPAALRRPAARGPADELAVKFKGDESSPPTLAQERLELVKALADAGLINPQDEREVRWTRSPSLRFSEVGRGDTIDVEFEVDSNPSAFQAFAMRYPPKVGETTATIELPVECNVFDLGGDRERRVTDRMRKVPLVLRLREVGPVQASPAVVGIDFGHNTTVVAVSEVFEEIRIESLEQGGRYSSKRIESTVALKRQPRPTSERGIRPKVEIKIGFPARDGASEGDYELFQSVKRWMVNPTPRPVADSVLDALASCDAATLPAELFLARILRAFRERKRNENGQLVAIGEQATRIVVTYPTKFNVWEVNRLRWTFRQAFLRALAEPRVVVPDEALRPYEVRYIDEAYAGGLYLIYQDYLHQAGGATAMRYRFPKGMNFLSVDVGGGTTDAALLRVELLPSENGQGGYTIWIRVLGRSGDRKFGGDTITKEVFLLLKARLAAARNPALRAAIDGLPKDDSTALARWLDRNAERIDEQIPTRSDQPEHHRNPSGLKNRRDLTQKLWDAAESVKLKLSDPQSDQPAVEWIPDQSVNDHLKRLIQPAEGTAWQSDYAVTITRAEVEGLVAPRWQRSIDNINAMLRTLRAEGAIPGNDVDVVYLIGNGSLYPPIRDRIVAGLRVRFAEDRIRRPDDESKLKDSVALGAALLGMGNAEGLTYRFETAERLPHDVGCRNLIYGPDLHVLFKEHTRVEHLAPVSFPVPAPERTDNAQLDHEVKTFALYSRTAGEPEEPFLECVFPKAIQGPSLTVSYDRKVGNYSVRDSSGQVAQVQPQPLRGVDYIPLIQSGKL